MSVVSIASPIHGRLREFFLLLLAFAICGCAFYLTSVQLYGSFPSSSLPWIGACAVITVVAHLVIRWAAPFADPLFFPCALLLTGIGTVMIYRIDAADGTNRAHSQLALAMAGVVLMVVTVVFVRDHRWLRKFTWLSVIGALVLLLLPALPVIGREVNGARIWINIAGFSYQPAELAKIFLTIFFAGYLIDQRDNLSLAGPKVLGIRLPMARHFIPIMLVWLVCMGVLALQHDFGTALLFFGLFVAMLFIATERLSWIIIGGLLSAIGVVGLVKIMPHVAARFEIWRHPFDASMYNAQGGSYQVVQGVFGLASGGLLGTGWAKGYPDLVFAAQSDYIFASLGEELGLAGVMALLCVYLVIVMRAMRTATLVRDGFGKLLSSGFACAMAFQCFVVIGGVTLLIPLTGLALPFLAHGGSALLTNWIIIGLLIRISDAARRPSEPVVAVAAGNTGELPSLHKNGAGSSQEDSLPTQVVKL